MFSEFVDLKKKGKMTSFIPAISKTGFPICLHEYRKTPNKKFCTQVCLHCYMQHMCKILEKGHYVFV